MSLTIKQQKVYDFIKDHIEKLKESPSLNEIMKGLDIPSKRGVVQYLDALQQKGYISRNGSKSIELTSNNEFVTIPVLGIANAGKPLAVADQQYDMNLSIDKRIVKTNDDTFAVIISGDSMNNRMIGEAFLENGDYAIVDKSAEVRNKDVILAVISGAATVKSFTTDKDFIILYPESDNPTHMPIYIDSASDFLINGKVVHILKNPLNIK